MPPKISPQRKTLYYAGIAIAALGSLVFFSVFVTGAMNFGNFNDFEARTQAMFLRAIVAMGMIIFGIVLFTIGARGLAGSGVILDPSRARTDLEPYTRMAGGMIKDALQEVDLGARREGEQTIVIRCRACAALNDEEARFCKSCGVEL